MLVRQPITYTNGRVTFRGQLVFDDAQPAARPGVLVFPEAFGLNAHALQRAERLAQLGYVALAADPHGEAQVLDDTTQLRPAIQACYTDRGQWRSRARAAFDALCAQPQLDRARIAAIGFCFGGTTALELARSGADLRAVVTFHAGLLPQLLDDSGRMHAKLLICHGAEDPLVTREAIDTVVAEFRREQLDWQFIHYGGAGHSFSDPDADARGMPGMRYDAKTERRSWQAMRHFLDEAFA